MLAGRSEKVVDLNHEIYLHDLVRWVFALAVRGLLDDDALA